MTQSGFIAAVFFGAIIVLLIAAYLIVLAAQRRARQDQAAQGEPLPDTTPPAIRVHGNDAYQSVTLQPPAQFAFHGRTVKTIYLRTDHGGDGMTEAVLFLNDERVPYQWARELPDDIRSVIRWPYY